MTQREIQGVIKLPNFLGNQTVQIYGYLYENFEGSLLHHWTTDPWNTPIVMMAFSFIWVTGNDLTRTLTLKVVRKLHQSGETSKCIFLEVDTQVVFSAMQHLLSCFGYLWSVLLRRFGRFPASYVRFFWRCRWLCPAAQCGLELRKKRWRVE